MYCTRYLDQRLVLPVVPPSLFSVKKLVGADIVVAKPSMSPKTPREEALAARKAKMKPSRTRPSPRALGAAPLGCTSGVALESEPEHGLQNAQRAELTVRKSKKDGPSDAELVEQKLAAFEACSPARWHDCCLCKS